MINKIKNSKFKYILLIGVLLLLTPLILVVSRYIATSSYEYYLYSKKFFFYSDMMDRNNPVYNIYNWNGLDHEITLNVTNKSDDLNWTNYDIDYEVSYTCPDNVICNITSGNIGKLVYSTANPTTNDIKLSITPKQSSYFNNGDIITINIACETKNGYHKKLDATYNLIVSNYGISYIVEDQTNRLNANIVLNNNLPNDKEIKVTFNNSLGNIDMTNSIIEKNISDNTLEVNGNETSFTMLIEANTEEVIIFYKANKLVDYTYPTNETREENIITNIEILN